MKNTQMTEGMFLDRDIASAIGKHFYGVITGDKEPFADKAEMIQRCKDTKALVDSFKILNIHFDGKDICITTSRPGIFIGRSGEQFNKLVEALRQDFSFEKINIIEDQVVSSLDDFHYILSGYEDYEDNL